MSKGQNTLPTMAYKVDKPLVLIGMMGAGKSSLGKQLAKHLDLPFFDADNEIEAAANMSIPEIFEKHGEAAFRDGERRVIRRLIQNGPQILALGGGAFMNADTRAEIKQYGISLWLDVALDELVDRVKRKPGKRPLLKGTDVRAKLNDLLATRGPVYAEADIRTKLSRADHMKALATMLKDIETYLKQSDEKGQS
jgi:shikimate kinase